MALLDDEVSRLVNHLIDQFVDRGEVDFAREFSVPFPSQVFLTLLGLPLDQLDRFLAMKDGIIRPDHVTGRTYGSRTAARAPAEDGGLGLRLLQRGARRARGRASRRPAVALPRRRGRGRPAQPRRTSWTSASCSSSPASTPSPPRSTACSPTWPSTPSSGASWSTTRRLIPSAIEELLRWETPVMGMARVALAETRARRLSRPRRRPGHVDDRLGQHRRGRVPRRRRRPFRPRGQPPPRLRRRGPPLPRLAPGPAWSCGSRSGSGTAASPSTRSSPATRSSTPRPSVPSSTFPCASRPA